MKELVYLETDSVDPAYNLAFEQYVFDRFPRSCRYLMLWQNNNAVIVGKNQNTAAEVNGAYVAEKGISVVRRLSGGGAVFHDLGNLNYTFIGDAGLNDGLDFSQFCRPVVEALADYGVTAAFDGRNDITIEGKKFSGNAQYLREGRIMHHGTILFCSDLDQIGRALNVNRDKIISKGSKSVRSRVTNLCEYLPKDVGLEDFKRTLLEKFFGRPDPRPHELLPQEKLAIRLLAQSRYRNRAWNYNHSPNSKITRQRYYDGVGTVEVHFDVEHGIISSFRIFGDFFGSASTTVLAELLEGVEMDKDAILDRISSLDLELYIHNLSKERFAELIVYSQ